MSIDELTSTIHRRFGWTEAHILTLPLKYLLELAALPEVVPSTAKGKLFYEALRTIENGWDTFTEAQKGYWESKAQTFLTSLPHSYIGTVESVGQQHLFVPDPYRSGYGALDFWEQFLTERVRVTVEVLK